MKLWKVIVLAAVMAVVACGRDDIVPEQYQHKPTENNQGQEQEKEQEKEEEKEPVDTTPIRLYGNIIGTGRWSGLDLYDAHVITKITFSPKASQGKKLELGLFEGANKADFSDALPLYMIKAPVTDGALVSVEINCSRGFRYVRYKSPSSSLYNLASMEFYGYKDTGDDSKFYQITNLPTVVINTEGGQNVTSKTTYINSTVYIISQDGKDLLTGLETGIRGRGNASWGFPKKPYKLKFAEKQSPLGAPSHDKKWTLINNYGDKTLMRNILAFEVSRRVGMAYTPFCTPVDVILNGEYEGCYQFCDQVEVGTKRVEAKDGYLIEIDAYAYDEAVNFYSAKGTPVTVKYPKDDEITTQQLTFIKNYFAKMENAVNATNFKDPAYGYRKYLDLDSFLQNFIVGEFCGNTDTYWSVNMYKDGYEGALFTGPVWDYDLAFENDGRTYPINNINDFIYASKGSVASDSVRKMVNRIVKQDTEARKRLVEIWDQTKPKLEDLNDYVDQTAKLLDQSQELNFKRWPILNQYVHQNPQVKGTYKGEVDVVKNYITRRLTKFDQLVRNY